MQRPHPLLLFIAAGCLREGKEEQANETPLVSDTGASDSEGTDSGTTTGTSCDITDAAIEATAAPGVAVVRWTTPTAGVGSVAWGYAPDALHYAPAPETSASATHAIQIVGAAPGTTVWWAARTESTDGPCESDPAEWTVGAADWTPVTFSLTGELSEIASGFRVVPVETVEAGGEHQVVVVDDQGRVVWSWTAPERHTISDVHVEAGGASILALAVADAIEDGAGSAVRVWFDRRPDQTIPLPFAHHAFDIHDDGRIAWIAADARYVEGQDGTDGATVAGDAVMVAGPDGENPEMIFTGWDHWVPDLEAILRNREPGYPSWEDWTHLNSLSVRADGGYLLSFRLLNAIVALDASGRYEWMLSGEEALYPGDFTYLGTAADLFTQQHSATEVEGGLLLFDNGDPSGLSEAREYAIDPTGWTFEPAWEFDRAGSLTVLRQGDVQRVGGDHTLVTWSSEGIMTEAGAAGETIWEIVSTTHTFGFAEHVASLGGPPM